MAIIARHSKNKEHESLAMPGDGTSPAAAARVPCNPAPIQFHHHHASTAASDPVADMPELDWVNFPALPIPNYRAMNTQAIGGFSLVCGICCTCLFATHASALYGRLPLPVSSALVALVW